MAVVGTERDLRVIFAGGGTGGHVMPGVAVAEALSEMFPGTRCLFLFSGRTAERHCHGATQRFEVAEIPAARREGRLQKLRFAATAPGVAGRSLEILRRFRPHAVVGLGGCTCVVPLLVARALAVPTMVLESNAVPGCVVRRLAPFVQCVQIQWDVAVAHLRARRVCVTGHPVRGRLFGGDRHAALERSVLSPDRCTLLAMGGSQGALPLNRLLWDALGLLVHTPGAIPPRSLQVLHLTGPDHLQEARHTNVPWGILYRPVGFQERMEDAYAVADFVLARAGGSSLAELTALGLPSLLVPYPHATDDHQSANAAVLAGAGAAVSLVQAELTPGELARLIADLVNRPERRQEMARAARALGRPHAARAVATELAAMAGRRPECVVSTHRNEISETSGRRDEQRTA